MNTIPKFFRNIKETIAEANTETGRDENIDDKEQSTAEEDFGRIFGTALRIVLVSSSLSQVLEQEMNTYTISFVYGEEPMECLLHPNCPMRFQTEDMRMKHYGESCSSARVTLYQCRSCLRSNRQMLFASRAALIAHKRNPNIFCNRTEPVKEC